MRPQALDDFIGQPHIIDPLRTMITAALRLDAPLPHVLFTGPPGLGKTTLARLLAAELGAPYTQASGTTMGNPQDLVGILANVSERAVLFIDEVHRLPRTLQEVLYTAMEDWRVDIVIGNGPEARVIPVPIPPFTLAAATTRVGMVTPPLRGRFGAEFALDYYPPDTLALILARACTLAGHEVDTAAMNVLAANARGTARTALMLLSRAMDYATTGDMPLTEDCARRSLAVWGVSKDGLERTDRAVLRALYKAGRPIGLMTLCAMLGEEPDVMLWGREPYLLRLGLIERTPQGRTLSSEGMLYYERYGREREPVEVTE